MSVKFLKRESGVDFYELSDGILTAEIITYGARIFRLFVPTASGEKIDVVAGFDSAEKYMGEENPYFNAVIGRVANRIGGAKFTLDGKDYTLFKNDGNNHLHGGKEGFDRKNWTALIKEKEDELSLNYVSKEGEEGYPHNLLVTVTYKVANGALTIDYKATADGDTLCALTNHAYFNLEGDFLTNHDHLVYINSTRLTDIDGELIPHGEILDIKGSCYDFSTPKKIGQDINAKDRGMVIAGGYDFNYIFDNTQQPVAYAYAEKTGVKMEVYTDQPCMQFYSGNFLAGTKGKKIYNKQSAFCMETQGYPNACNVQSFPSMVLKEGETYHTQTTYKFTIETTKN